MKVGLWNFFLIVHIWIYGVDFEWGRLCFYLGGVGVFLFGLQLPSTAITIENCFRSVAHIVSLLIAIA